MPSENNSLLTLSANMGIILLHPIRSWMSGLPRMNLNMCYSRFLRISLSLLTEGITVALPFTSDPERQLRTRFEGSCDQKKTIERESHRR